jgi:hypothetical protein
LSPADATAQVSGGRITGSLARPPEPRGRAGAEVKAQSGDATYTITTDPLGGSAS